MRKTSFSAMAILTAGLALSGNARAQQTPAANPPASPSKPATPATKAPAKTPATGAAKTGTGTGTAKSSTAKSAVPTTPRDKASYAIGLNIGKGMHKDQVDVNPEVLLQGLKDGLSGGKALMTDDEIKGVLTALQAHIRQMQDDQMQKAGVANKAEGDAFLAANKAKEGVVTLPDGLQYKILTAGTGAKPAATDSVVCNYRGTLINGKEFDSSYKRGQPATFGVSQVIKGWTEALQMMPTGSKWQLFIPAEMAYGARGAGQDIGPNATLIFEVELLSIQAKAAQ